MVANVKRVVAVLVSIVWLSLIVVLVAGSFVPAIQEVLPPQVREFTDLEALREWLGSLTDSLATDISALIPTEPEATETPTPDSALSTPPTATPWPATPTAATPIAATPIAESATPSPTAAMDSGDDGKPQVAVQPVSITVAVARQAKLYSAPSEDADLIGLVATGGTVTVNGKDPTGRWYRLEEDVWIGADELVDALQDQVPVVVAETQQPTPESGEQPTQTETPAATPTVQLAAVQAVVRLDANLRSGPGIEFERVDGVFAGDELSVVGQSADGEWYLLDRDAWLFTALVVEAVDVPVVSEDGAADLTPSPETDEEQPEADEEQPETDEEQPEADEEQPETDEEQPETDEEQPETDEEQPEAGEEQPEADEEQPEAGEEQPEADEEQPEAGEEQPEADDGQPQPVVIAPLGANLRSGPGVEFDRVEGIEQGQVLTVVAQDSGGDWLKLDSGLWIFAALVDNLPEDLPVESEEGTDDETDDAGEDGETPAPTDEAEPENTDTDDTQPSDEPEDEQDAQTDEDEQPVLATVNTDANLRNGPGLDSTIVDSVPAGTQLSITGRSDDEQWLQLDNDQWIFAALVDFPATEAQEDAGVDEGGEDETGAQG